MIFTLTGNNSFALQARLDELVGKFVADHGDLALERLDVSEMDARDLMEAVQAVGFLSANKLLVLRGFAANKHAAEQVEQILGSVPETTDVIIYEPATDKRTVFYKYLKANTQLEEYPELDANQLASWLVEEAKKADAVLSFGNARYLTERAGFSQMALANELKKLILYDKSISKETIDLLVEPLPQSKIFELLDAAFSGNKKRALDLYNDQRAQRVEPQAIMAMLAWQLQIFALAKAAGSRSASEVAMAAGMNPYPVTKAMSSVSRISQPRLNEMIKEAAGIDYQSKTSGLDLDEALKTYIITL